jgi:hypothetical protein
MAIEIKRRPSRRSGLEELTTVQLLTLHEWLFGPLQAKTRQRMLEAARRCGWDDRAERRTAAA